MRRKLLLFQLECISYDLECLSVALSLSFFLSIINLKLSYYVPMCACQLYLFISCGRYCFVPYIYVMCCLLCTRPFHWLYFCSFRYQFQHELSPYRCNHNRKNDREWKIEKRERESEKKRWSGKWTSARKRIFLQGLSFESMRFDWCGNKFYVQMINLKHTLKRFWILFLLEQLELEFQLQDHHSI